MMPCREVLRLLQTAYPCAGFDEPCAAVAWAPGEGEVPRGFCGATGTPGDVRLVLVMGEADAAPAPRFAEAAAPREIIAAICRDTWLALSEGRDSQHRNLRHLLRGCFPGLDLPGILRHAWITRAVLCAPGSLAEIPPAAARHCRQRYLDRQLALFPGATVMALGQSAARRLGHLPGVVNLAHPAPPEGSQRHAREGWNRAAAQFAGAFGAGPAS